jgi:tetratricopeptide (TPR) repeat protein
MTFNKKLSYTCTSGIITYLFVANSFTAFAQEATEFWNERHRFNHVNNLYHQQLYRAANLSSLNFSSDDNAFYKKDYSLHLKDQIELVGALAGLKFNQLPHHTPIDVLAADNDRLNAAFGSYYYKKKDWSSAINYLSNINNANLSNNDIAAIKFELAYAYFNNKQFKEAKDLFEVIKNTPGTNQHAAKYYLGLIEYNNGSYKNALENFKAIEQLPNYKNIVPYYIAEIHYFDGAKELALQKAKEIANQSEKSYYHNEVQLLIAQCLYEQEKYAQALPYFEYYHDHVDKIHKQDLYKIGYAYYKTQQFDKAIAPFKQLSSVQDNLGQTALYYLGDCYIKTGNKTNAKNAFNLASEMTFAQPITESSLLLSGKLGFELGYANEATEQLQTQFTQVRQLIYFQNNY